MTRPVQIRWNLVGVVAAGLCLLAIVSFLISLLVLASPKPGKEFESFAVLVERLKEDGYVLNPGPGLLWERDGRSFGLFTFEADSQGICSLEVWTTSYRPYVVQAISTQIDARFSERNPEATKAHALATKKLFR